MRILPSLFAAEVSSGHLTYLRAEPACLQYLPPANAHIPI
jgi:hypothetical protein